MRRNFAKRIEDVKLRRPGVAKTLSAISSVLRLKTALVDLRSKLELTQRNLSEITGWKQPQIARIETIDGAHTAKLANLVHYAEACNASIGIIFIKEEEDSLCVHDIVPLTNDPKRVEFMEQMKDVPCGGDKTKLAAYG